MVAPSEPKPVFVKVDEQRERLRAQDLRPIQIWVSDVHSPSFREQALGQSRPVVTCAHPHDDQAFIDAVSDWATSEAWRRLAAVIQGDCFGATDILTM